MIVLSPSWLTMPVAALYGAVIGSFLANAAVRIPEDRSLVTPSSCPRCGARIRWTDNVPVVSWLVLRGRCRSCGQSISPHYPLVEALCAVLAALVARHVFTTWTDLDLAHVAAWIFQFGFVSLLVLLATVDIRHRIIPDETSIYAVPFGIAGHGVLAWLGYDGWWTLRVPVSLPGPEWLGPPAMATVAAGVYYALFWVSGALTSFFARKDALGFGDVKLAAMIGSFLGLQLGLVAILTSSLLASFVGIGARIVLWRMVWLPYGPAAAVAAVAVVLYGDLPVLDLIVDALSDR